MRKRNAPPISPFQTTGGKGSLQSGRSGASKVAAVAESLSGAGLGPAQLKSQYLGRQVAKNTPEAERQDSEGLRKRIASAKRKASSIGGGGVRG